jgi:hypothetical protein
MMCRWVNASGYKRLANCGGFHAFILQRRYNNAQVLWWRIFHLCYIRRVDIETRIRRCVAKRERIRAELDAELRTLVCEAFAEGLPGRRIAEAAGVKIARIYQIRDGRR